ncbi:MAG TPA: hypothetical protein VJR27_01585 [Candidatus Saccharimonadales bacterium]|nr:hypothetical protein [Candidatus Saccharimonadales bacterium]
MDRDFLSTLAFVRARDGIESPAAQYVDDRICQLLGKGALRLPDIFFRFRLHPETSLQRQQAANTGLWRDVDFLKAFDVALDESVSEFFSPTLPIVTIDGSQIQEYNTQHILERIEDLR